MRHRAPLLGFTLTEVAIVFAVVGVILAGIWTLYNNATHQLRANKATIDIRAMMINLRNATVRDQTFISGSFTGDPNGCTNSYTVAATPPQAGGSVPADAGATYYFNMQQNTITSTLAAMGVYPQSMLAGPPDSQYPVSPWGGNSGSFTLIAQMSNNSCNAGTGQPSGVDNSQTNYLTVVYKDVPSVDCTHYVSSHAYELASYGLEQICVSGANDGECVVGTTFTSAAAAQAELSLSNASYWCTANNTSKLVSMNFIFSWPPPF